jgi:hypothetical protein
MRAFFLQVYMMRKFKASETDIGGVTFVLLASI